MKTVKKIMKKENGVTLVELLAAIAILSIIVTAFLAFFIQAANTNSRTDDKNEATFLAVEEMERVTNLSNQGASVSDVERNYTEYGYEIIVEAALAPEEGTELYKVTVTVNGGGRTLAQMETRLPFATDAEE